MGIPEHVVFRPFGRVLIECYILIPRVHGSPNELNADFTCFISTGICRILKRTTAFRRNSGLHWPLISAISYYKRTVIKYPTKTIKFLACSTHFLPKNIFVA